jgi:site-specific DNA recombinase
VTLSAGIYARISSDRDLDRLGVDRQVADCRTLCADRGWDVADVFVDNDLSASSGVPRPEYERLLRAITAGQVQAVAVWDLDRLTRKPIELEQFTDACDQVGVSQLAFVGGQVDLGTGDGLLVARIKGAVAAEEVRKVSQRQKRAKLQLAEQGKDPGGSRTFGRLGDRVTIDPVEAELIRDAARRILEGDSLRSICTDWTEQGVPTAKGGRWTTTTISQILTLPRTAGLRIHQGVVVGDAAWEPILDMQTYEQVKAILSNPSRRTPPGGGKYPLKNVLVCGSCGSFLVARPRNRVRKYGCRTETGGCGSVVIKADPLEEYIFGIMLPIADSTRLREAVRAEEAGEMDEIRNILIANSTDESSLVELESDYHQEHVIERATYLRQTLALRGRIEERTNRLSALHGRSALDRLGGQVAETWDTMSTSDRSLIIRSLIEKIIVHPARVRGRNAFDPLRVDIKWRYDVVADVDVIVQHRGVRPTGDGWERGEDLEHWEGSGK